MGRNLNSPGPVYTVDVWFSLCGHWFFSPHVVLHAVLLNFYVVCGQISIQSKADRDPHSDILDFLFLYNPFSVIFYSANSNGLSCPKLLKLTPQHREDY